LNMRWIEYRVDTRTRTVRTMLHDPKIIWRPVASSPRTQLRKLIVSQLLQIFVTLVAMLIGIFLMVGDEVIGLINPNRQLTMTWPLGLHFTIWQSWEIVFVIILLGTVFYIVLIEYLLKALSEAQSRTGHMP